MPSHYTLLSCLTTHISLSFSLPQHSISFPSWYQSHSLPLNQSINCILLVHHIYYCTFATATTTTNYFNTRSFFNMKVSFAMLALAASLGEVSATVSLFNQLSTLNLNQLTPSLVGRQLEERQEVHHSWQLQQRVQGYPEGRLELGQLVRGQLQQLRRF